MGHSDPKCKKGTGPTRCSQWIYGVTRTGQVGWRHPNKFLWQPKNLVGNIMQHQHLMNSHKVCLCNRGRSWPMELPNFHSKKIQTSDFYSCLPTPRVLGSFPDPISVTPSDPRDPQQNSPWHPLKSQGLKLRSLGLVIPAFAVWSFQSLVKSLSFLMNSCKKIKRTSHQRSIPIFATSIFIASG